jgi:hypothetical protein
MRSDNKHGYTRFVKTNLLTVAGFYYISLIFVTDNGR